MAGRVRRRAVLQVVSPEMLRCVFLALCVLAGAFAGYLYARSGVADHGDALRAYLSDYGAAYAHAPVFDVGSCAAQYLGYAAVLFLLGFSSVGAVLIPVLAGALGFLTMYTVGCFSLVYGRQGVALAVGLLLVRLLFTLPCFFSLADRAWPLSTELALLSLGRGRRSGPVLYDSRYFLLFFVCVVILAVGILAERLLTPLLFRLALGEVMI